MVYLELGVATFRRLEQAPRNSFENKELRLWQTAWESVNGFHWPETSQEQSRGFSWGSRCGHAVSLVDMPIPWSYLPLFAYYGLPRSS